MLKCLGAGAYFAGCLMGAALNEALLSLVCLFYQNEVKSTKQYEWSTKKGRGRTVQDLVGSWKLDQFIRVAEELSWVPSGVVAPEYSGPLADVYKEIAPVLNPSMTPDEIERSAGAFRAAPGPRCFA